MRNLLAFLIKNNLILIFILLMSVSIWMYLNFNSYQRNRLLQATTQITGSVNNSVNNITTYLNLKQANIQLAEENAYLRSRMHQEADTSLTPLIADTATAFTFISAKVISNSVNRKYNYFMINKGRAEGIMQDQGVVSSKGVVGIITEVSEHYSSAISLINLNCQISARLKNTNEIGRLTWLGDDYKTTSLQDIPTHIKVNKGDTVITSGYSHIFQDNLLIGTVDSVSFQSGDHFYNITIKLAENFNALYHVYTINNIHKDTIENLTRLNETHLR